MVVLLRGVSAPAGQIPRGILKTAATPTGAGGHAAFGGFSSVTGGSFRGFSGLNTGAAEVGKVTFRIIAAQFAVVELPPLTALVCC